METDQSFTARQSLDTIAEMILQAKGHILQNSFYFLLWGWVVAIAHLGVFALLQAGYAKPYQMWLITLPAALVSFYYGYRSNRQRGHTTILGQIMLWLWVSFCITLLCLIFFGANINYQLNPLILLLSAIPTLVSGVAMRFRPLVAGGILFWIGGIACFLASFEFQNLIAAGAVIGGYLIPGHLLKSKQAADHVQGT